mgnify:CR=1 FL=1
MAIITNNAFSHPEKDDSFGSIRDALPTDAAQVSEIYRQVYNNTYSYTEYTDSDYLMKDIRNKWTGWYVMVPRGEYDQIAGCVSTEVDPIHHRAYGRGLMMHPKYQGLGVGSRLGQYGFERLTATYGDKIRFFYSENRAVGNSKSLKVVENIGFKPLGILPYKDVFFNKRESPVLMALHSSHAWKNRKASIRIIPRLIPLKAYIDKVYKRKTKGDDVRVEKVNLTRARTFQKIIITKTNKPFGYVLHTFTCSKTGESLDITVNLQNLNAENMHIHCSSPITAKMLMEFMMNYFKAHGVSKKASHRIFNKKKYHMGLPIQYIEGYCPSDKPEIQQAFIDAGLRPLGWIPTWERHPSGTSIDHVIFGWSRQQFDPTSIAHTRATKRLANTLFNTS